MTKRIVPRKPSRIHHMFVLGLACWLAAAGLFTYAQPVLAAILDVSTSGDGLPAIVGTPWTQTYQLVGGVAPFTCHINDNRLPGLRQPTVGSCSLTGTPTNYGSYPVTVSISDSATPKNSAELNFDLRIEAKTQIEASLRSSHPDGETQYVAGFPVWVQADVSFDTATTILEGQPAGTIQVSAGIDEPACSMVLDANGAGECVLIFPTNGTKTVLLEYLSDSSYVRSSTRSSSIDVQTLHVPESLSAGRNHTCFHASDGLMTCWGLGDALPVDENENPLPKGNFSKISAGGYQTCGLNVDGSISCWGDNTEVTQAIPAGQFLDISSGDEHVCAIDLENILHCWGNLSSIPTPEHLSSLEVTAVSAGSKHTCVIRKSDSRPECWGSLTTAPNTAIKALAAGNTHTCAINTNGSQLACWGTLTGTLAANVPAPAGKTFTRVDSGSAYTCTQMNDGTIACWGTNPPGVESSTAFLQFASGFLHTCALRPSGATHNLSCWGDNAYGKAPRINPLPTSLPQYLVKDRTFTQELTGLGGNAPYSFSIMSGSLPAGLSMAENAISGTLTAAGSYSFTLAAAETFPGGSLPLSLTPGRRSYTTTVIDGTTTVSLTLPTAVNAGSPAAARVTVSTIPVQPAVTGNVLVSSANGDTYCRSEVNSSGIAQCTLYFSQSGLQTVNVEYEGDQYFKISTTTGSITVNPIEIEPQVGAGDQFSCSLDAEGRLACWGMVSSFQYPTPSTGIYDQLDLGKSHACALGLNRQVTCWGWNGYGVATPPAITGVTRVTTGNEHTCALTDLGNVSCWGWNDANRLAVPLLESGITYTDVDAGAEHTCAIDSTGVVRCWGLNAADGRISVPPDLLTRGAVEKISSGGTFTCGLHANGSLECWGNVGVVASTPAEPSVVFSDVSAGRDFACALEADGSPRCWGTLTSAPAGPFTQLAAGFDHVCGILQTGRMQCWGSNAAGQAPVINITPEILPTIDVGAAWGTTIIASGGRSTDYSYNTISGSLPAGLLGPDSNTGLISGTPAQAGIYPFVVHAQEKNLTPALASTRAYSLTVRGLVNATVDSALPAGAMVGRPIQVHFSVQPLAGNSMGAVPSGRVTIRAEDNRCEVDLVDGMGSCRMLFGNPGNKTISISYPGDGLYQPSDTLAGSLDYEVFPFNQAPQLRTGLNQTYIFKADGTAACIGASCDLEGRFTRLGAGDVYACGLQTNGSLLCQSVDTTAPLLAFNHGPYIDLSVGKEHVCALQIDGHAECLGSDSLGQSTPPAGIFAALSAGDGHTCALQETGEAVCWGEISPPPTVTFTHLVSGNAHTCGLRSGGGIDCWGADSLGLISLPPSIGEFTQIAAGGTQTCGLDPNGEITCWQIDNPDSSSSVYGKFIALAVFDDHGCGMREGLKLTCWGEDDAGEAPQFTFDPLDKDVLTALSYFEHAFNVSGGVKPLTAEVVEGRLPPGIDVYVAPVDRSADAPFADLELQDLSPAGMILYGAPNQPGVYPFVLRWTDVSTYPLVMEHPYSITISGVDLSVELFPFSPADALAGMEYRFKAVVKNNTTLAVPGGVVLTIKLPVGLIDVGTDTPACSESGSTLICPLGAVDPSETKTIWVSGKVAMQKGQTLEVNASVVSTLAGWPEIDNEDNTDSLAVKVAFKSVVFNDNFDLALSSAWTGGSWENAPNTETNYLAMLSNDQLFLDLSGLPTHKYIVIRFDLYVVGDWAGNNSGSSSSEWRFGVTGLPPLLHTSFSNIPALQQAYPDAYPGGVNPARQGQAGSDELDYEQNGNPLPDTRYQMSFKFLHSAEELQLFFNSVNLPSGAWWGLDSVTVMIDTGWTQIFLPLVTNVK